LKSILLTLAMFGAVLILSVFAMQYADYRQEHSVAGMEARHRQDQAVLAREKLDARVAVLSGDRCEAPVEALLALNSRTPIIDYRDIPEQVSSDIALCMKRDLMGPRFEDQLTDSKLMRFFG